eukprot:gb/GEZN01008939.1/.p1 GENE.gb/GEZN01008939.1/~~gb/GEZN01008939.1/.p1  ORF type:complete len:319 (-),score=34.62 gb/GEZN01008939.1/:397-1353(-)
MWNCWKQFVKESSSSTRSGCWKHFVKDTSPRSGNTWSRSLSVSASLAAGATALSVHSLWADCSDYTVRLAPIASTPWEKSAENAYNQGKKIGPEWFKTGDFGANVTILSSVVMHMLLTKLRDQRTQPHEYVIYSDRLCALLAEEGLARTRCVRETRVQTPCGPYVGFSLPDPKQLCVVSIMRSGDILLQGVVQACPGIAVGKLLIQRDNSHPDKLPLLFYSKLPGDVAKREVLLVDPMLGTGGSAKCAIQVLLEAGVAEESILFLNVISCPEGLRRLAQKYPKVRVLTLAVDPVLDDQKYIVPGLGDFGDRYYDTPHN